LFKTKRGLLALLAFATIWFIILYYFVGSASAIVSSPSFEGMAQQLFGTLGLTALLDWPVAEYAMYWLVAVYFFPSFALLVCSDQFCSDKHRGTLRFITLRATRAELIVGRYLGQLLIMAILILMTSIATTVLAIMRDLTLLAPSLQIGAKLTLELVIVAMPFIALMTLLNTLVNSARLAVVAATLIFALGPLSIAFINYQFGQSFYLNMLLPGEQISSILSQNNMATSQYILPLVQTLFLLIASHLMMKRASL
tara:strand:- start:8659 stop:9420 length:762 start_codon:yes stop_codon:yes gene_type:complete